MHRLPCRASCLELENVIWQAGQDQRRAARRCQEALCQPAGRQNPIFGRPSMFDGNEAWSRCLQPLPQRQWLWPMCLLFLPTALTSFLQFLGPLNPLAVLLSVLHKNTGKCCEFTPITLSREENDFGGKIIKSRANSSTPDSCQSAVVPEPCRSVNYPSPLLKMVFFSGPRKVVSFLPLPFCLYCFNYLEERILFISLCPLVSLMEAFAQWAFFTSCALGMSYLSVICYDLPLVNTRCPLTFTYT